MYCTPTSDSLTCLARYLIMKSGLVQHTIYSSSLCSILQGIAVFVVVEKKQKE